MGALGGPIQLRQRRPSKTYRRFVQTAISVKVTVTQSEGIPFQILRRQSEIVHVPGFKGCSQHQPELRLGVRRVLRRASSN